ncbi:RapZ C-terminal domain-containing protein [Candidatus Palauibacter sp.]|uniref:RapZ C-terminal domain-containing protein n=1 Tax=Candidatus Palauibacter sp. TaxID=3101350 RepID=UPI003AF2C37A
MTPGTTLVDLASALFVDWHGELPDDVRPVAPDGSARSYWRLTARDGTSAVGAHGPDSNENRAFLSFSRTLHELGLPVPEVYGAHEKAGVWLLEDLGDTTLFDTIKEARGPGSDAFPEAVLPLYRRVLEILPRFQIEGGERIDFRRAYPRAGFDRQSILWDLNYFKYHFLKLAHIPFNEARLERDFSRLARHLLAYGRSGFLYRDLQSRNVMVRPGPDGPEPWFIDYQGGRRGALQYDVASLLYDAKANLAQRHREALLDHYIDGLEARGISQRDEFLELWPGYVLVRVLQALGAYGYRGFFERKPGFLQSVPYAAENLRGLLDGGLPLDVPELEGALGAIADRWGRAEGAADVDGGLEITLSSFRFSGGYPADTSGHGGGHVFDCRGLPNPGREEAYRQLTGLDEETIAFIAARPEAQLFWEQVRGIVDEHIANYVERGFHSLSVHFGCTGGQHRSVYMAERLSQHILMSHPDVRVTLTHRESADWPRRPARV